MTTLKSLPYFIKTSHQYKSFLQEMSEDDVLTIDPCLIINDLTIKNIDDFKRVLNMVTYWNFVKIPIELYAYTVNNRKEVLNFLSEEDALHYKDFYMDVLHSNGLLKNKEDVINYLNFNNENVKELEATLRVSLKIDIFTDDNYALILKHSSHKIEKSQQLEIVVNIYLNDARVMPRRHNVYRIDKYMSSSGGYMDRAIDMYRHVKHCISILTDQPNITELTFCKSTIPLTDLNRDKILYDIQCIEKRVERVFFSFFPIFYTELIIRYFDNIEDIENTYGDGEANIKYDTCPFIKDNYI
jgi:hypothetical protein